MNKTDYVRNTIDLVKQIETRFLELGARFYKIREEKLWEADYENYADFLSAAHINPGFASMLASIHRCYVVEGGKDADALKGIGYSNLYEAIPLIERDGVDKAVVTASELTRSEIKDEVREHKHGRHEHVVGEERFGVCTCGKFIRV